MATCFLPNPRQATLCMWTAQCSQKNSLNHVHSSIGVSQDNKESGMHGFLFVFFPTLGKQFILCSLVCLDSNLMSLRQAAQRSVCRGVLGIEPILLGKHVHDMGLAFVICHVAMRHGRK